MQSSRQAIFCRATEPTCSHNRDISSLIRAGQESGDCGVIRGTWNALCPPLKAGEKRIGPPCNCVVTRLLLVTPPSRKSVRPRGQNIQGPRLLSISELNDLANASPTPATEARLKTLLQTRSSATPSSQPQESRNRDRQRSECSSGTSSEVCGMS